jgi:hypothetical protein
MARNFNGPLFIVGMSRSGTKLLRNILNNSKDVAIPAYESHLLPYLIKNFCEKDFPLGIAEKRELKKLVKSSIFYNEIKRKNENFKELDLEKLANQKNIQDSIQYMMTVLANQSDGAEAKIWGDKTPNNLFYIKMLKNAFPEAKFIHIIRDPRERALSANKAWHASLLMCAERWRKGVSAAREQGSSIGSDYLEVTYESLIDNPQNEIKRICNFLDINYSKSMLRLDKPAENYKTADNVTRLAQAIVSNNTSKFKLQLSSKDIEKIEAICGDLAVQLGYTSKLGKRNFKIPQTKKAFLKARDSAMTIRFHIKEWGIHRGTKYLLWRRKVTNV